MYCVCLLAIQENLKGRLLTFLSAIFTYKLVLGFGDLICSVCSNE